MTSALEDTFAFQLDYPDRKLSPNARGKWILKEDALNARIAELESQVNQLIEAGFDLSSYVPFEFPEVQRFYRVMKECKPEVQE